MYAHRRSHHTGYGQEPLQESPFTEQNGPWVDDDGSVDLPWLETYKKYAPLILAPIEQKGVVKTVFNFPVDEMSFTNDTKGLSERSRPMPVWVSY